MGSLRAGVSGLAGRALLVGQVFLDGGQHRSIRSAGGVSFAQRDEGVLDLGAAGDELGVDVGEAHLHFGAELSDGSLQAVGLEALLDLACLNVLEQRQNDFGEQKVQLEKRVIHGGMICLIAEIFLITTVLLPGQHYLEMLHRQLPAPEAPCLDSPSLLGGASGQLDWEGCQNSYLFSRNRPSLNLNPPSSSELESI